MTQPDPIAGLYKMSMTAGLGSQEYVAVNVTSVIALLFGPASLLALISPVLLVVPVVGIILSVVALWQIGHSNGTQTGRGLASIGLSLALLITGGIFTRQTIEHLQTRADQQAISQLCTNYGQLVHEGKFEQAYELFDDQFKKRVPLSLFVIHLRAIQNGSEMLPPIEGGTWNGIADFNKEADDEIAESMMKLQLKGIPVPYRMGARFRKTSAGWKIDSIDQQFPPLHRKEQQPE